MVFVLTLILGLAVLQQHLHLRDEEGISCVEIYNQKYSQFYQAQDFLDNYKLLLGLLNLFQTLAQ